MRKNINKGLDILLKTYWSNGGWQDGNISKDDFNLAKNEGYMFDYPKYETHSAALKRLDKLLAKVNYKDIVNAFLYSLSTRKLEYRSALGSYFYAIAISNHELSKGYNNKNLNHCYLCGWQAWEKEPSQYAINHGVNVFNFERFKWGGVRHTLLNYVLFDLEMFLTLPKVLPSESDKLILKKILECPKKLNPNDKASQLVKLIVQEKILKCNKDEVRVILEILSICGILVNKEYPSFCEKFVDEYSRSPLEYKNDFSYPLNRWRALDGVDYQKVKEIFKMNISE